ncbi:RelA / SpoT domain protein [Paraburkholderia piptadeniae]|uniref:RelA / SpoT domain protein n=1 Tax=Paraburkholderia piptadeniae TaxID=1701573 RepID=A0A1N7SNB3_9BURK|nr:RelA/SpoT domain-containing protein [Paraburkholderia piptadeniae]SIT48421.1 RelA / SpoT domain protein [Paraburkholderia piptadeniae]
MTKNSKPRQNSADDNAPLVDLYKQKRRYFELFLRSVEAEFSSAPELNTGTPTVIHSLRGRLKDEDHLLGKIARKHAEGRRITKGNLFSEITDFAGLRVLHLYQGQFSEINKFIMKRVKSKVWRLVEKPIAYTWDPESADYFKGFKLRTSVKPSYYTSVHYVLAPANLQEGISCEVQVRTLFEEAWGEIDHSINYPVKTEKMASIEQLRVLSKLVSTGSRLADAIFRVHGQG